MPARPDRRPCAPGFAKNRCRRQTKIAGKLPAPRTSRTSRRSFSKPLPLSFFVTGCFFLTRLITAYYHTGYYTRFFSKRSHTHDLSHKKMAREPLIKSHMTTHWSLRDGMQGRL